MAERIYVDIEKIKNEMIKSLIDFCKIPAIGPMSDGDGENKKANKILELISDFGFDDISLFNVPDERISSGYRSNIVAILNGSKKDSRTLWVIVHMDTAPPGEISQWDTDPYSPMLVDDKLYGRGVEDNGQSLVSTIYAIKSLINSNIKIKNSIGIVFVSDEEEGSGKGIKYLIDKNIFNAFDLILVPDSGHPSGEFINVGGKSRLTLEIKTSGVQTHASRPHKGVNALSFGSIYMAEILYNLHHKYSKRDMLFDPPFSTFEPTRVLGNNASTNTIPGSYIFYLDCRILPILSKNLELKNNDKNIFQNFQLVNILEQWL